ncbi:MAG: hypothetical protein AAFY31_08460 [Pseudomonadota bacterium]
MTTNPAAYSRSSSIRILKEKTLLPCNYVINENENLIVKTYAGRVTARCVLQMLDMLEVDPAFHEEMREFDDLRDVTDLAITATEIKQFGDLITGCSMRRRRPARKAIVAPSGPGRIAAHGFCQDVRDAEGLEVGVFDEVKDALAFLDITNQRLVTSLEGNKLYTH